jgi:hypothetical protein
MPDDWAPIGEIVAAHAANNAMAELRTEVRMTKTAKRGLGRA